MAESSYSYNKPKYEVELYYDGQDREKVESICDVLRTVYSFNIIKPDRIYGSIMGILFSLFSLPPITFKFRPLLFLSKSDAKQFLDFYSNCYQRYKMNMNDSGKIIICITCESWDDISSLLTSENHQIHLIDAREGTSANNVASLIVKALNPADPVLNLTELVRNIKLDPYLSELVKPDKVLGPIFQILQTNETNQATGSGENVQKHHGMESPLLKVCTPKDIITEMPIWKGRMEMLLVLTDQVDLAAHLETIEIIISSEMEEPLPSTSAKQENTECGDWDCYVKEEDKLGMCYLVKVQQFPTKQQLTEACEKFGRKSQLIHKICDIIGCNINTSSKYIVWPAYRIENENDIIFVTDCPNFQQISDFEIKYWNVDMVDSENSEVIKKEVDEDIFIDDQWMHAMKYQINTNSSEVREKHRNITIMTASPFRSKGYKKGNHEMIPEHCIVLLVPLKGLIPLQDEPIPNKIGGIKTDIREDSFQWQVDGNPFIEHNNLKIGCAIGSPMHIGYGTLGGFVDHPVHGLCALTCAHVLLSDSELQSNDKTKFVDRVCVQPSNSTAEIGKLKESIFEDRNIHKSGIDVALIKLEVRFPDSAGNFPDTKKKKLFETGFNDEKELKYTSGKVCLDIKAHKRCQLVKYGATTTLTHGIFGFNGLELAYQPLHYPNRIVLRNQIQVNHIHNCQPFSKPGDSGSLMFILLNNELVAAGLVLGGGKSFSVVTPICEVLQAVGCRQPPMMKTFPDNNISKGDSGICSDDQAAMEVDVENTNNTS